MKRWILPIIIGVAVAAGTYQSTLLATPYALMHAAIKKVGRAGPENQFSFSKLSTADFQPIVRPSPDLSYTTCVFDISKGPVLVNVEPIPDHYWAVGIYDARTDVAAVRSARDTGGKAAKLALYKEGQTPPAGYDPVKLEHDRGLVLIRILLANPDEFPAIDALRRKSTCRVAK